MIRMIPNRLKPSTAASASNSAANSRSASPARGRADSTSPESRNDTGLVLNVVILKARNLAAKDRNGTSDPYLVLTLGDAKHVTHAVSKTLNPEWNEICQLPVNGMSSLLLDVCCWDKDRFGKDYLGEFDLALEEIFTNDHTEQDSRWFPLKSKRPGKKTSVVSGEVLLQFTLLDVTDKNATDKQIFDKFDAVVTAAAEADFPPPRSGAQTPGKFSTRFSSATALAAPPLVRRTSDNDDDEEEEDTYDEDLALEDEDLSKPEAVEKQKRRLRIKGLKKKRRDNPYEFTNSCNAVLGIIFLEIKNITDLPPESNFTKTSFDMDPFVVASLGRKTFRTKTIHHNLNPVFNEKMVFQVLDHERTYSFSFTVIDRDKYSGNDFIASASFPLKEFIDRGPKANPETGLYDLLDPPEFVPLPPQKGRFKRLGLSRSSSAQSLVKLGRFNKNGSGAHPSGTATPTAAAPTTSEAPQIPIPDVVEVPPVEESLPVSKSSTSLAEPALSLHPDSAAGGAAVADNSTASGSDAATEVEDPGFTTFSLPLKMKSLEKWEDKHNPQMVIRAKYMPYPALRQQFWRAMLKQYDADESGNISKVELSTMLDTLGSTLRESTIDSFFRRFVPTPASGSDEEFGDLTVDQVVVCLEDQLEAKPKSKTGGASAAAPAPAAVSSVAATAPASVNTSLPTNDVSEGAPTVAPLETPSATAGSAAESAQDVEEPEDLSDPGEEHVVEIRTCPICHQPRLNKRRDADIITHIATCASQDWRQVNDLVMAGFVTPSQAQRKWYSKVVTKISYGGYRIGANSANILVQDRITGLISEEKMSVYVRLGIRLLYKGLRSNNMENKRIRKLLKSLSIKQGKKYDDPATKDEIQKFIDFHQLNMSEVLLPVEEFKNFNEFFYRALKPGSRPCAAPNNPGIVTSPADCRSVVFNRIEAATKIWIKGREFSVQRLLGEDSPEDASKYENGALGIFRLAPQDYHRFHVPVDGVMGRPRLIAGEYYTVNPMAIRSALDVYGENVRVIVPIDSDVHGRVIVVCVGAMMVGSTVITRTEGERVQRAEELGYFKFGGSTIVLLFEEGRMNFDSDLAENSNGALETLIRAGMSVGHLPNEPQWALSTAEVTEQDKMDARRRIQGSSVSEDVSPEDSSSGDDAPLETAPSSARATSGI